MKVSEMKLRYSFNILALLFSTTVFAAEAESGDLWPHVKETLSQTWQSESYELYIPVNVWHNRNYYSKEKISSYNENPWGLGVGKYRFDDDGDWNAVYAMVFLDSHSDLEPVVGYGFQKMWRVTDSVQFGAGYTAGLTARNKTNYMPIPLLAPLLSVEYKKFAVQTTYIPGGHGNGNVLFTWLRWQLQ